jgi:glyoxylase-like metal-dependent hydrolase (beta-lactamase superfamily II)
MSAYMASLARLQERPWRTFLPGHGAPVTEPAARLDELVAHRRAREAEILAVLAHGPADVAAITRAVYSTTPVALRPAAERNVLAHLLDLEERNRVAADGSIAPSTRFRRL